MWSTRAVEYRSAREGKDGRTPAVACEGVEDMISQVQKDTWVTVLYDVPRGVPFTETESKMVARGLGTGTTGLFSCSRALVWGEKNALPLDGGEGRTTV